MMEKRYLVDDKEIMRDWDVFKNINLDPKKITYGSDIKVWWKCHKCNHEWVTKVSNRTGVLKRKCPKCAIRIAANNTSIKAAQRNNFKKNYPYIAREWHPTKNENLRPEQVSVCSDKYVWWKCSWCGNEWKTQVKKRTKRGYGCPKCAKPSTSFCEQAIYYYIKKVYSDAKNRDTSLGFELDIFIPSISVAIEYDGIRWHNNINSLKKDNTKDDLCKKNNLTLYRFRDYKLEDTKNARIIHCEDGNNNDLKYGLERLFLLLNVKKVPVIDLEKDMSNILSLYRRNQRENSLAFKFPDIAKEWHPFKNGNLTPENVSWGSNKKVWWKCSNCGYEWRIKPNHRTGKNIFSGCYKCARKRINKSNQVQIINLDTGQIFDSLTEAASFCHGSISFICGCCNKRKKTAYGYHWDYVDENQRRRKNIPCKIRNIDTGEVFENSRLAAISCNGDSRNINRCCNGKTLTAYGYHWENVFDNL